jgi:TetR/AcrR family transcriptional regulator, ethionamide resistance regulator
MSGLFDVCRKVMMRAYDGTVPSRRSDATTPTKGDRREQALLTAAERLLTENHFEKATIAELAAEAGISRATFYFYFASKQDLLAAVIESAVAGLEVRLADQQASAGESAGVGDIVAGTVRAAADLWWEHRVVLLASVELGSALPEVYARNRASITQVSVLTRELLEKAGHCVDKSESIQQLVTALVLMTERNFYDLARGDPPRTAYDDLTKVLVTVWIRALGVASP